MNGYFISGTGCALPKSGWSSDELDAFYGLSIGYLEQRTGVNSRYFVSDDESQISLAVSAAKSAIDDAKITAHEIDQILFASGIGYQTLPSTAPLIQRELGISDGKCLSYDINSTCLSFVSAFQIAALNLQAGQAKTILIVSSELASRALPWKKSPDVAALFGDGAAACVLQARPQPSNFTSEFLMKSFPSAYEACQIAAGGTRYHFEHDKDRFEANVVFNMDGKALFKLTSRYFSDFVDELLEKANWKKSDVDWVIPHQASPHALELLIQRTGFARENVVNIVRDYGNQIAASIPFALNKLRSMSGQRTAYKLLFLGTSAGVSFGGFAYEAHD